LLFGGVSLAQMLSLTMLPWLICGKIDPSHELWPLNAGKIATVTKTSH
jgi:hypothetical protein